MIEVETMPGSQQRQQHVAKALPRVGAEHARRLLVGQPRALQRRQDDQTDERGLFP